MMPSSASLSSKKSLHRLEMRRFPFEGSVLKMNELSRLDFERIREMHEQNIVPIQNSDVPPGIRGYSAQIGSKRGWEQTLHTHFWFLRIKQNFGSKQQHWGL
jgi:hypothetical protein